MKKYIEPKNTVIELEENIACICGSQCDCRGNFHLNRCSCKSSWWWPFSSDTEEPQEEDSQLPKNHNVLENEW